MSRWKKAALPLPGLVTANPPVYDGSLVVTLRLEDDAAYVVDLSDVVGPERLRMQLNVGMVAWSTREDGARRVATVKRGKRSVSAFLRWVNRWNAEESRDLGSKIESLEDLTRFHLLHYREDLRVRYSTQTLYGYFYGLSRLLDGAPGVAPSVRQEAAKRRRDLPTVRPQPVERYSSLEFTKLHNAARRQLDLAHARITQAYTLANAYDDPACPDSVRASALHEVIVQGTPQSFEGLRALGATATQAEARIGLLSARRHLYLSTDEALAAIVLLVCQRGFNLSAVVTAIRPHEHEPGVMQMDLDKPRRGPNMRYWPEIMTSSDTFHDEGEAGEVVRLVAESTEPARQHLLAQGRETDRLIVYWPDFQAKPRFDLPEWQARKRSSWIPAGIDLDFQRLRRSVPSEGVAKEPTHHSSSTYLHYVRSDPISLNEQREEAALGVQKLVDHVSASFAIRVSSDTDTNPRTDAVIANCSDPQKRPDTGAACTTGFYSFLDCLDCRNAATVPRLLPRQIATLRVLEELRDSVGAAWERRFADRYFKLLRLVSGATEAEREAAELQAGQHIPLIVSALRREVPA